RNNKLIGMLAKLRVLDDAVADIQNAVTYYNRQQQGLGRKFKTEINLSFQKLQKAPQAASFAYDTVRYKIVDKFPFIILYEQTDTHIAVLRVFNTHQDTPTTIP